MRIARRELLGLIGAVAAPVTAEAHEAAPAFVHGVAAGDPLADRLIIWTRLTVDGTQQVDWQVATDAAFTKIVRRGRAVAEAARDHTIKIDVDGLKPGADYYYRFLAAAVTSPIGRARTLPAGKTPDVVMAVVSCQLHPGGLFNAYDAIAKEPRLDVVVHLGDYIYEYGAAASDYGMSIGQQLGRIPSPPKEILTLADYRQRHAQYKTDADLQAAHARAAFICVWDDHEGANDAWAGGAENHQPATEGDWTTRRAHAIRAYYEWMPIREPAAGQTSLAIQRRFDFGDLATLHMVETRFASRSQQLSYADVKTPADAKAFETRRNDPARELLGPAQARWLAEGLKASHAAGRPWQILGNQVVMAEVFGPAVDPADATVGGMLAALPAYVRAQFEGAIRATALGLPQNMDSWDGYPAARDRLYTTFQASGARPVVLSGDSHAFWVNELKTRAGATVAVELGTTSISSPSNGDAIPDFPLGQAIAERNDQVVFCDQRAKGYILLTLKPDEAVADLRAVSTIYAKPYEATLLKRYRIPADPKKGNLIEG